MIQVTFGLFPHPVNIDGIPGYGQASIIAKRFHGTAQCFTRTANHVFRAIEEENITIMVVSEVVFQYHDTDGMEI